MYPKEQMPNAMQLAEISYLHSETPVSFADYFLWCPMQYILGRIFIWKFESLETMTKLVKQIMHDNAW